MTQTIYSIYQNQNLQPGIVEIINMYDGRYYSIAIDGQIIAKTQKESYEKTVLKRSFIKKCSKISGVDENNLIFVHIDFEEFGDTNMTDYDANDFDEYSEFTDFFNQNPNIKFVWATYSPFVKILATGIDNLDKII